MNEAVALVAQSVANEQAERLLDDARCQGASAAGRLAALGRR